MFSESAPPEAVDIFAASVRAFNPAGFRAMTWSSAEADLRDVLATIVVPTLLLYGDQDVRAPLDIAHDLHAAIAGSELITSCACAGCSSDALIGRAGSSSCGGV